MNGYTGMILRVDLGAGTTEIEAMPDEVYERYLSGVGLGAYVLYRDIPPGADPLGPDNVLGFVSGLLTGTGSVMTGRWMAVCKSPLTGGWGDANCGGTFSPAIKRCGFDGIFIKGISKIPVYLYVGDAGAEIRDASAYWGMDAVRAEEELEKAAGKGGRRPAVAAIGTSGERLSLISGICNDGGRIAARSGVGAVMGSKRLKAVVLAGTQRITCHDPAAVKAMTLDFAAKIKAASLPGIPMGGLLPVMGAMAARSARASFQDGLMVAAALKKYGTIANNAMGVTNGDSPVKNWAGTVKDYGFLSYRSVNPDRIVKRERKKYRCYSCVIGCGGECDISGPSKGEFAKSHKPEYETVCAFGSLLLNTDLDSIFYINELLNRAGMDSISAGGTIAFAIECFENGILTEADTGGLVLAWGESDAIVALVKKMIAREGLGDVLADGSRAAAARIGKGAEKFAVHAGGQEPGMHDPRFDPLMGVHYSADPTPGRHTIGGAAYYGPWGLWEYVSWAPKAAKRLKDEDYVPSDTEALKSVASSCFKELIDGAGGCLFAANTGVRNWRLFDWLNAATGWTKTPDEYMEIGKRIQTLRQMFNVREGYDPRSGRMARRMCAAPPDGPNKGREISIDEMLRLHWRRFGWEETSGAPKAETIAALGLERAPRR
jgi:aldehyde:ferredoxin oxidoreductase